MGRCNCGTLSPNGTSNGEMMSQGFADETVVVIKRSAYEDKVTYRRIKLIDRDKKSRRRVEHVSDVQSIMSICHHEISFKRRSIKLRRKHQEKKIREGLEEIPRNFFSECCKSMK